MSVIKSSVLGFPRIGAERELKRAVERHWSQQSTEEELLAVAAQLRERHWKALRAAGLDHVPCGDFSLYDHVLDTALMVGALPERYASLPTPLRRYFAAARGYQRDGIDLRALEMTKWFDTNYHSLVPELEPRQRFSLDATWLLAQLVQAKSLGIVTRPVVLGPVSFLRSSKRVDGGSTLELLTPLLEVYVTLFETLAEAGVRDVQLDEPALVLDADEVTRAAFEQAFARLSRVKRRPAVTLTTYFGALEENLPVAMASGFETLHVDLVRGRAQLGQVLEQLPESMRLSLGLIDGRNVWRADLDQAHDVLHGVVQRLGAERVEVSTSCSLLHVPVSLEHETTLDPELKSWLAFAHEKLHEVRALATNDEQARAQARQALASRRASPRIHDAKVKARLATLSPALLKRPSTYADRAVAQHARFQLPLYPTTTIGSFPQTDELRHARAEWRAGRLAGPAYERYLEVETARCIDQQESLGLDVLVHGEFERTDMVEYFGEQLSGFAFTRNGWVQSYGSRCVKPPILYGDVSRPQPMTVRWATRAQALTKRPVKGMLTGPVTILQWSFVRDDQPRRDTCLQLGFALRDEVNDLEAAGIGMIQVDEPAVREGLPLRQRDRDAYLRWAVDAFLLATSGVGDSTQVHTHMCYSEFGDVLEAIAALDADVLSIETSRSRLELLRDFERFHYPNAIGPGLYDIHSPRVPTLDELTSLLERAVKVLPKQNIWVNPDCGLKTRGWPETQAALRLMVDAARVLRKRSQV